MSVLLLAAVSTMAHVDDFIEVAKSITVNKSVDEVWKSVGDFCATKDWHPSVDKCGAYDDHGSFYRKLTLTDSAAILKKKKSGEEAKELIEGIFDTVMNSLTEKFK